MKTITVKKKNSRMSLLKKRIWCCVDSVAKITHDIPMSQPARSIFQSRKVNSGLPKQEEPSGDDIFWSINKTKLTIYEIQRKLNLNSKGLNLACNSYFGFAILLGKFS